MHMTMLDVHVYTGQGHEYTSMVMVTEPVLGRGHGYAAWTWTSNKYLDIQHGHGPCNLDMDMQHRCENAAWT
jgi:hypothetical protein